MFTLDQDAFGDNNLNNALEFVDFWDQFYSAAEENDDYLSHLNIGHDLTLEDVQWLIEWKLPRPNNHLVELAANNLQDLNRFRHDEYTPEQFLTIASNIYQAGHVMSAFLFHICFPTQYPIWDRFTLKSFRCHMEIVVDANANLVDVWEEYEHFREYFNSIVEACHYMDANHNIDIQVMNLKRVDNALMSFGQFLSTYGPP